MKRWINFDTLRKQLNFEEVLKGYNVHLKKKEHSDQHVGDCPLPTHEGRQGRCFSANFTKGLWQCFGCKQSGNVLDFAVLMEGKNKKNGAEVRETAMSLQERFLDPSLPPERPERTAPERPRTTASPTSTIINRPLDFALKTLEREHPYFGEHKISAETIARFGLGFCKRGSLAGRIAIPLEDDQAQLIGYTGLVLDETQVSEQMPKYQYPGNRDIDGVAHVFDRNKFLYNGFRVSKSVKDLIVVLEPHVVWALWQAGFANVVSLMGYECSHDQVTFVNLLTQDSGRVWLLTDESAESETCARDLLYQVALSRSCRWVRVDNQDRIAPDHPLLAVLPKR